MNEITVETKRKIVGISVNVLLIIILSLIAFMVLFPLYFVLATSLKDYATYIKNPFGIDFGNLAFSNYVEVLMRKNILNATLNSIIVSGFSVLCMVLWTALASFGIGVVKFKGCGLVYFIAISTMFFSGEMVYVPLYLLYGKLNLLGSFWALLVPSAIGLSGLGVIMGSGFSKQIPNEIHEAAFLDGANLRQIFFQIDMPMLKPILAMTAIMQFQGSWGDFFWPLITVIGNPEAHTLPLMIVGYRASDAMYFGQYCAGLTIMTFPIVLVYCFFSKYFMQGMAAGAIKG